MKMLIVNFLLGYSIIPIFVFGSGGDYDDDILTYCEVSKKFDDGENVYNIQCTNSAPCCYLTVEQSCNKDGFGIHHISYGKDCQIYQFSDVTLKFLSIYENNAENDTEKGNVSESMYDGCNIDVEITGKIKTKIETKLLIPI